ncbi:hypothetical protein [Streptomyces sp. AK02-01A]|uniref:hypothetical protein n=1 Tax=Streptomyces sp. AK02-01A TaxID=3028648 RepID=UPI0029A18D25|nr:hypothetical protein [Streptomyces sp. AK02-01A]MDX3852280.1 hypothetical protein [Streptomyces sp. AK02-01A]
MSLVKLIAQADERGLAASGLGCLDRCLPPLADGTEALRPLWAGVVSGERDWSARLAAVREALGSAANAVKPVNAVNAADAETGANDATGIVRTVLGAAPSDWAAEPLRSWADSCSVAALRIHRTFDTVGEGESESGAAAEWLARCREDAAAVTDAVAGADGTAGADGVGPLVAGELRRQIRILEILAETAGAAGLRQAMDLSTEGQRVLRAVVSRRARAAS